MQEESTAMPVKILNGSKNDISQEQQIKWGNQTIKYKYV